MAETPALLADCCAVYVLGMDTCANASAGAAVPVSSVAQRPFATGPPASCLEWLSCVKGVYFLI